MTLAARAAAVFGFRVLPTALLTFLTYLAILVALVATDVLPAVPKPEKQGGLSLETAYEDLLHITAHPHPYNSHANDRVRAYLLARLTALSEKHPHVHVVDDRASNMTWRSTDLALAGRAGHGVYFEGTNLLVKVDGTGNGTGVLFSAHYDSVATARGATDDGMGVATLLQLVQYFAEARAPRTAVFNINNGEEDGLHGAHAFLQHPWSRLPATFLNLEGAAAGGRPILFRASSTAPVRALSSKNNQGLLPHPHANVLSSDAFARGLIRSGTDFSVYTSAPRGGGGGDGGDGGRRGMAGLDLAFYKGRSVYHTRYDSPPYTVGGRRSLWAMMEAARGIGVGLLRATPGAEGAEEADDGAVYFDLFKSTVIIFRLKTLLTFNVIALIVGPTLLAFLFFCEKFFLSSSFSSEDDEDEDATRPLLRDDLSSTRAGGRHRPATPIPGFHADAEDEEDGRARLRAAEGVRWAWVGWVWRHGQFWAALAGVVGMLVLLGWGYVAVNPFAIYASPYLVLFSFASLAYLTLIHVLTLPSSLPFIHPKTPPHTRLRPAQHQKQALFFHLYALTWLLLLLGTLGITLVHPGVGGGYLFSAWNLGVGVGCVVCVAEGLLTPSKAREGEAEAEEEAYEELGGQQPPDESTPLIWGGRRRRRRAADNNHHHHHGRDAVQVGRGHEEEREGLATAWWSVQFLVSVPVPVILFGQVAALLMDSVPQTLADGGAPWLVYTLTAIPAVFLVLPLAPFAYKLRPSKILSLFVLVVFIGTTLYAWLAFPFSINAPLKVFFQQSVAFPRQASTPITTTTTPCAGAAASHSELAVLDAFAAPTVLTSLTGAKRYLRTHLIPRLPSARGKAVWCQDEAGRPGLATCEWDSSALPPAPGSSRSSLGAPGQGSLDPRQFFKAQVASTGPHSAFVSVKGVNTRACRVYFDSEPIEKYTVHHLDKPTALSSPPVSWSAAARSPRDTEDAQTLLTGSESESEESSRPRIKELRLWSRTWDQELGVEFSWAPPSGNRTNTTAQGNSTTVMEGRIACEWAEYESGMVDSGGANNVGAVGGRNTTTGQAGSGAKIPALEEVLAYLPDWAVVSKASDGLVEAWTPFVV